MRYIITAFILGIVFAFLVLALLNQAREMPFSFFAGNISSPSNSIEENQIKVYDNKIIVEVKDASISKYGDTGSMLPLLNENSNGIRIPVKSAEEIKIGDIITFTQDNILVVHRVFEIGQDEQGIYFITKGDNNSYTDGKIRFAEIKYKTIGVLY